MKRFFLFIAAAAFLSLGVARLKTLSGNESLWPAGHPFTTAQRNHRAEFSESENVLISLTNNKGTIFDADFLNRLAALVNEAGSLPGADRAGIQSLFSPTAKVFRMTDEGLESEDIIPADFSGTPEDLLRVQKNIENSFTVGRLVTADMKTALIHIPFSSEAPGPLLQKRLRTLQRSAAPDSTLRFVGGPILRADLKFHLMMGLFLPILLLITALTVLLHRRRAPAVLPLAALGGASLPLFLSSIPLVQVAATLAVAGSAASSLVLKAMNHPWLNRNGLSQSLEKPSWIKIVAAVILLGAGASLVPRGTTSDGWPGLWPFSQYNRDQKALTASMGPVFDPLIVIAKTSANGCTDPVVMSTMDHFVGQMQAVPGIARVLSVSEISKRSSALWAEDHPKWRVVPKNPAVLAQAMSAIPAASGLLNFDCNAMPVILFLTDHQPSTLDQVAPSVRTIAPSHASQKISFEPGAGSAGFHIASKEEVERIFLMVLVGTLLLPILLVGWIMRGASLSLVVSVGGGLGLVLLLMALVQEGMTPTDLIRLTTTWGVACAIAPLLFERSTVPPS